jgi:hypothetical protein
VIIVQATDCLVINQPYLNNDRKNLLSRLVSANPVFADFDQTLKTFSFFFLEMLLKKKDI